MPQDFDVIQHEGQDVPCVTTPDGQRRLLLALTTPKDHPVGAMVTKFEDSDLPTMTIVQIESSIQDLAQQAAANAARIEGRSVTKAMADAVPEIDRVLSEVPIIDQSQEGACLPHAFASAMMLAKAEAGDAFLDLDPWFLYSLINGGVDQGSAAGDAVQALMQVGICPRGIVPYGTIAPAGYSNAAVIAAQKCKLRTAIEIKGYEQALTAILYGWSVAFDVRAGNLFVPDSNGVCRFLPGPTNHEVLACEQIKGFNGVYCIGGRNSWGTSWGLNGRTYWQPRHLDRSDTAYAIKLVSGDPTADPLPSPLA